MWKQRRPLRSRMKILKKIFKLPFKFWKLCLTRYCLKDKTFFSYVQIYRTRIDFLMPMSQHVNLFKFCCNLISHSKILISNVQIITIGNYISKTFEREGYNFVKLNQGRQFYFILEIFCILRMVWILFQSLQWKWNFFCTISHYNLCLFYYAKFCNYSCPLKIGIFLELGAEKPDLTFHSFSEPTPEGTLILKVLSYVNTRSFGSFKNWLFQEFIS